MPDKMTSNTIERIMSRIRLVAFDFDGVFTNNMVYVSEDGSEMVRCNRSDGIGLQKLRKAGIETIIISTETNPVVSARARKLKIDCVHNCQDKRAVLEERTAKIGISLEQVAFVGNDINDLACLTSVGLPIVVKDAHPDVVPVARYQTRQPGGHGAVREICDMIIKNLEKDD